MCSGCGQDRTRNIKEVQEAWILRHERWVVVYDARVNTYQTIPEKGYETRINEQLQLVFKLKN